MGTVEYTMPQDGTWSVLVYGHTIKDNTRRDNNAFALYSWAIPLASGGDMVVSVPDSATDNDVGQVVLGWTPGSLEDGWVLGVVLHSGKGTVRGATFVSVDKAVDPRTPIIDCVDEIFVSQVAEGSDSIDVTFGYSGSYAATPHGFVSATQLTGNIAQGDWAVHKFELADTAYFETYMPDFIINSEDVDVDLYLVDPNGTLVSKSEKEAPDIDELVNVVFPEDGTWSVYVHGYAVETSSDYALLTWTVPLAPSGNLQVEGAPVFAALGELGTVDISWTGATIGEGADYFYVGAVSHTGEDGFKAMTVVIIDF